MTNNRDLLAKLKAMSPEELKAELLSGNHQSDIVMDLESVEEVEDKTVKINETEEAEDLPDSNFIPKQVREYRESNLRMGTYEDVEEKDENEEQMPSSDAKSYQKSNDYVHYGLDYVGAQADPRKVDTNLPVIDYVFQLL